jgi:hypothetical protein
MKIKVGMEFAAAVVRESRKCTEVVKQLGKENASRVVEALQAQRQIKEISGTVK